MLNLRFSFLSIFLLFSSLSFAQRGKNNNFTVGSLNTTVNTYSVLTINGNLGVSNIVVSNNSFLGSGFTNVLEQGDLVLIIQMYGANVAIDWYPGFLGSSTGIPGIDFTLWNMNGQLFGNIDNYNNAGHFELREVLSVSGSTGINLTCPLENNYSADKSTQVIRVPRYNNLTVPTNTSIVPTLWNGTTGGVVAIEVNGNLQINGTGRIDANGFGFRPGLVTGTSITGTNSLHTNGPGNGDTPLGHMNSAEGGAKGESIAGFTTEYSGIPIYSVYGRGAIANGGGGGGFVNAGAGGGSNIGTGTFTGKGLPTPGYAQFWNLELAGFASTNSPGGGRGGYSIAGNNADESTVGPNQLPWGSNYRKENGGYGGHELVTAPNRLFLGGGGGAGGQDSQQGGSGGRGGGIVHLTVYGSISGSGSIQANGQNGQNSNPLNEPTPGPVSSQRKGNDGAGGGGGGGHVYIKNLNPIPSTISLMAIGGEGGDQDLRLGGLIPPSNYEVGGPGAGGGGGGISFTSGSPSQSVIGGASGIALQNLGINTLVTAFPPNGATNGGSGMSNITTPIYTIIAQNDTICGNQSTTLTATIQGTSPGGNLQWFTVPFGGFAIATGNTYNTPVLSSTTTYYVGICPGTFRTPVTVIVGQNPTISGVPTIVNANCTTPGSITGLSASGGVVPLSYSWNGTSYANANLPSAPVGSYTLSVSDANGCTSTSGPYSISGVALPIVVGTASVTNQTCTVNGSITGLSGSGGTGTLSYSWNGTSTPTGDLTNVPAGSYTLTITDGAGCMTQSQAYTIGLTAGPTINGIPQITDETCSDLGSITGYTVSGGLAPYSYTWNGTSSPTADLTGAATGNYMLQVTDNNGCVVSSASLFVDIVAGPTLGGTAVVTDVTCLTTGSITGITVSGGLAPYSSSWNGNSSPTTSFAGPSGTYTLSVTDDNGCVVTSPAYTIDSIPAPTVNISNFELSDESCGNGNGSITGIVIAGGTPGYTYFWNTVQEATIDHINLSAGTYTLQIVDQLGCTVAGGTYVISNIPAPTLNESNALVTNGSCAGNQGSITGITATGNNLTYQWSNSGGSNLQATGLVTGSYTLTVTDTTTGCSAQSAPYSVLYVAGPTINDANVNVTNASCTGALGSITGIVANGSGTLSYVWTNTTQTTSNLNSLNPGTYSLTVTDAATGCEAQSGPYSVSSIAGPNALFSANPVNPDVNELVVFNDLSTGSVIGWSWSIAGTTQTSEDASYTFTAFGEYPVNLTVTDQNGCTDTYSILLNIGNDVIVPNVITANNDGQNDFFEITYLLPNTELVILNRWGNEVFYSKSYLNDWKGNDKSGLDLSEGVYTYIIKLPNGNQKHGFVHLVR